MVWELDSRILLPHELQIVVETHDLDIQGKRWMSEQSCEERVVWRGLRKPTIDSQWEGCPIGMEF